MSSVAADTSESAPAPATARPRPPHRPGRLASALGGRAALPLALLLATVLALPALGSGFFLDDYLYLGQLRAGHDSVGTAASLYRLTSAHGGPLAAVREGALPWWFNTASRVELCRPLSGLLIGLDHWLWPGNPAAAHVHSLLWYLLLVLAVGLLYRRLGGVSAGLALLLFVIEDGHWQAMGWVSNRHGVVAAAPVLLGLVAHVAWRERAWRWGLPLSLLGYAVGLAGGETAVQALAFVAAYELVGPAPRHGRARALAPMVGLLAVYLVLYRAFGFGAHAHEQYLDPVGEPRRFLAGASVRLPTLLADLLAGLPADLWAPLPVVRPAYLVVGLASVLVFAGLLRWVWPRLDPDARRNVAWMATGALAAAVPGCAGLPGSRLVLVPGIGGAAVVATLLVHLAAAVRGRGLLVRVAARAALVWLGLVHLVAAPALLEFQLANMRTIGRATERIARDAASAIGTGDRARVDVAVLYAPDIVTLFYPPQILALQPDGPYRAWWTLSIAPHDHVFVRTGPRSFTLALRDGAFFTSEFEKLFRAADAPLRRGARVELAGLRVEVRSPTEVAFEADRALEDASLRLLAWSDGQLRRVEPPPVGATLVFRRTRGLLGL